MKKFLRNEGFTLVELMVVVAIIGILSAVAIPNFKQYQAKSKTSEAKLQLASIYSAETAFMSDWDNFATCLNDMGYTVAAKGYYIVGFSAEATTHADINANAGVTVCNAGQFQLTPANHIRVRNTNSVVGDLGSGFTPTTTVTATGDTFVAGAVGKISADTTGATNIDKWSIDENKSILQRIKGY